jgi:hypothetical protein
VQYRLFKGWDRWVQGGRLGTKKGDTPMAIHHTRGNIVGAIVTLGFLDYRQLTILAKYVDGYKCNLNQVHPESIF